MHLVVGYDSHPASRAALQFGTNLARALGARIHVVHVEDIADQPIDPDSVDFEDRLREHLEEYRTAVRDMLGPNGTDWDYEGAHGSPSSALIGAARRHGAALIVVGQPHRGISAFLDHAMSESVSRSVLHKTEFAVLVVPEFADVTGVLR